MVYVDKLSLCILQHGAVWRRFRTAVRVAKLVLLPDATQTHTRERIDNLNCDANMLINFSLSCAQIHYSTHRLNSATRRCDTQMISEIQSVRRGCGKPSRSGPCIIDRCRRRRVCVWSTGAWSRRASGVSVSQSESDVFCCW